MTPTQDRNSFICSAMYMLTKDQPPTTLPRGGAIRVFTSGELWIMASEIDGMTVLDAR